MSREKPRHSRVSPTKPGLSRADPGDAKLKESCEGNAGQSTGGKIQGRQPYSC